jgi:tetratricopeptide (TPR) repeat protein
MNVNLFSAVTSSIAVCVMYYTMFLLIKNRLAALSASLLLAFTYPFWLYSLVAEIYSLNNLLLSFLLLSIVLLLDNPRKMSHYYYFSFILAMTIISHYTILFFLPGLGLLLFFLRRNLTKQVMIGSSLCFFLGLLPLVYLPVRAQANPLMNWGKPDTPQRFFNVISRKDYGTLTLTGDSYYGFNLDGLRTIYADFMKNTWGLWALIGMVGIIWGWHNRRKMTSILLLGFICIGPLFILLTGNTGLSVFSRASLESFSLPPIMIWTLFVGFGITAGVQRFKPPAKILNIVILIFPVLGLIQNYQKVDQHNNLLYEQYGNEIFSRLPQNAVVLTFTDRISMISRYLQIVENQRPDVVFISFTFLPDDWYAQGLERRYPDFQFPFDQYLNRRLTEVEAAKIICEQVADKYPVFVERQSAGFNESSTPSCSYAPFGLLVKVNNPKSQFPEENIQADISFFTEKQRSLEKEHVYDLYTRSILSHYAESATALGKFFELRNDKEQAVALYHTATSISPDYPESYYLIGLQERANINLDESMRLHQQALEADPSYYPALKELGVIYVKYKNDYKTALRFFERYMVYAPPGKEKTEMTKLIRSLRSTM